MSPPKEGNTCTVPVPNNSQRTCFKWIRTRVHEKLQPKNILREADRGVSYQWNE